MAAAQTLPNRVFRAEVLHRRTLTPGMVRITLGGPDMADYATTGVGDEYLRLFLPEPHETVARLPFATEEYWDFAEDVEPSPMRTYTVRAWRPGEIDIDFVVHPGGVAAEWAMRAEHGHVVGINTPRSLYAAPADAEWVLLLADATGLPAAARLLEQLDPALTVRAIIEIADAAHRQEIAHGPNASIEWIIGGNGHGRSAIADLIQAQSLPSGPGYVWVAGETRQTRAVRKHLRHGLGLPAHGYKIIGYWVDGDEDWAARYEGLDESVRTRLRAMWDQKDKSEEEITDEYEDELTRLGL